MGYYTDVNANLTFTPELDSLSAFLAVKEIGYPWSDITSRGLRFNDNGKFYGIDDEVKRLIEAVKAHTTVSGTIIGVGEEQPDIWRIVIKDNVATREEAQIVWPDGSPADI